MLERQRDKITIVLALVCIAVVVLAYNLMVPYYGDDLFFLFHIATGRYMTSFTDYMSSAVASWLYYSGRFSNMVMMPLVVGNLSKSLFSFINTLVVIANISLIGKLTFGKIHLFPTLLTFVSFVVWGDALMWDTAVSVNYEWTLLLVLIWILCLQKQDWKNTKVKCFLLAAYSFVVGTLHEMYSLPFAMALVVEIFLNSKGRSPHVLSISPWSSSVRKVMSLCFLLGATVTMMSPALFSRATSSEPFGIMMCVHHLMKPMLSIGFVVVCVVALCLIRKRVGNDSFKKFVIQNRFFLLVGIFGLIPSFGSGQGGRALFCANVFMLMVVLKAISLLLSNTTPPFWRKVRNCSWILFVATFSWVLLVMWCDFPKWRTYKKVVSEYLYGKEHQICYHYEPLPKFCSFYLEDLSSLLYRSQTVVRLQMVKRQITMRDNHAKKMVAIPDNLSSLFYRLPYSNQKAEEISSGRVYTLYKVAYLPCVYLKVNYTYGDVVDPRPFQLYCDRNNHKWILLNKKYHHFPLTKIEKIGVDKYENYTKFQIFFHPSIVPVSDEKLQPI